MTKISKQIKDQNPSTYGYGSPLQIPGNEDGVIRTYYISFKDRDGDIRYWSDCENGEEYYKIATAKKQLVSELKEDVLSELEQSIISLTLENMAKCKIKVCQ